MKNLITLSIFLTTQIFASTLSARITFADCGELSAGFGDACYMLVETYDKKQLSMIFDFDKYLEKYRDADLEGLEVLIKMNRLEKITNAHDLEIFEWDGVTQIYYADLEDISVIKDENYLNAIIDLTGTHFSYRRLPAPFESKKLDYFSASGDLADFITKESARKVQVWKEFVLSNDFEYGHLSDEERMIVANNPLEQTINNSNEALLEVEKAVAIFKNGRLIGYYVQVVDYVQSAIYQDGAWFEIFISVDQEIIKLQEESA